jgi:rhodanese-related sulfurtransferase
MEIKEPLDIDYDNISVADLVEKLEFAIEQHPSFLKVIPEAEIKSEEDLNSEREWRY